MALNEAYSGSVSITTTEISLVSGTSTLQTLTTNCVMQAWIDFVNVLAGDEYVIKIYEKVDSAGTKQVVYEARIEGAQSTIWASPPLHLKNGWDVTVQKVASTARTIRYSIRTVT